MATITLLAKRQTRRWWFRSVTLIALSTLLIASLLFIWILQPVWSVPWRSYPIELVPDQAYQRSSLWQASQKQQPSLGASLATLPLQQAPQSAQQSLSTFRIPARYEHLFCTGDTVLLRRGQQQSHGILRLKVAAGAGQQTAQFGIELFGSLLSELPTPDNTMLRLQRLSYQPGDWRLVTC